MPPRQPTHVDRRKTTPINTPSTRRLTRERLTGPVTYYTAIAGFVADEIIEWPLALFVAAGHALATHSANPALEAAGSGAEATA